MRQTKKVSFKNLETDYITIRSVKILGNCQNFKISKIGYLPLVKEVVEIILAPGESLDVEVDFGVFDLSSSTVKGDTYSADIQAIYNLANREVARIKTISFESSPILNTKPKSFKILSLSNELLIPKQGFQNLEVINSKDVDLIKFYKFLGINDTNGIIQKDFKVKRSEPFSVKEINNFRFLPQQGFPIIEQNKFSDGFLKSSLVDLVSTPESKDTFTKTLIYFNDVGLSNLTGENNFPHPWLYSVNASGQNNLEKILEKFNWNSIYWPNYTPLISNIDDEDSPTSITLTSGSSQDRIGFYENVLSLNNGYDSNLPSSSGIFEQKTSGAITGENYLSFESFASEWNSSYSSLNWEHKDVTLNQSIFTINSNRVSGDKSILNNVVTEFPSSITDTKNQTWSAIPTGEQSSINSYGTNSLYELWKFYSSQSGLNITETSCPWQPWAIHPPYILSSYKPSFYQTHSDKTISYNNYKSNISNESNNFSIQTCSDQGQTPYVKSGTFSYTDLDGASNTIHWETCFAQAFIPISISGMYSGVKDYLTPSNSGQILVNHTNLASISIKII